MKSIYKSLRPHLFILFVTVALLLPELMLRCFIGPGVFDEQYVTVASDFFAAGWIIFFIVVCVFVFTENVGKIVFLVISVCFSVLSLSECVYYKIFEQFFWIKSIGMVGEGIEYFGYAAKLIEPWMIVSVIGTLVSSIVAVLVWWSPNLNKKYRVLLLIIPILILFVTHFSMQADLHGDTEDEWDVWRKPRIVYKNFSDVNKSLEITGLYHFSYLNLYTSLFPHEHSFSNDDLYLADEYLALKAEKEENSYSGVLKDKNVIAVMMESIDTWMIDEKMTPTIHKMMKNGINFTNYNAPFFGIGYTFSSEFAFNTGFYTPTSASSASNFSKNTFPYSLARLFKEAGYTANSFHFNSSEFYNRGIMHRTFGYEKYNSAADFGIEGAEAEIDSNLIKNDEFYKKMISKTPFFDFFITYSAHLPYQGESEKLALAREYRSDLVNEWEDEEKNNAKILAADTDEFFRILLERLETDGLLDDTVIIGFTDHFAYGVSSEEKLNEWKGEKLSYCVPAFIYNTGLKPKKVTKPMMTIDWAPTIVNLFDLSREAGYLGNDVFDSKGNGLVYFETGAWMDENMYYIPTKELLDEEDMIYIQKQMQQVKKNIQINDIVILGDFYKKRN